MPNNRRVELGVFESFLLRFFVSAQHQGTGIERQQGEPKNQAPQSSMLCPNHTTLRCILRVEKQLLSAKGGEFLFNAEVEGERRNSTHLAGDVRQVSGGRSGTDPVALPFV